MEPIAPGSRTMQRAMAALFLSTLAPPAALAASCPVFPDSSVPVDVTSTSVTEASGLAISGSNPGIYWTHNNSGDSARFFAVDGSTGGVVATYELVGASAVDWEDMALGPGPVAGVDYLYLADIGDNAESRPSIRVYRVPGPAVDARRTGQTFQLTDWAALDMFYPDGAHNAETIFVDPRDADLYVVTKSSSGLSHVFLYPFPHDDASAVTMTEAATVSLVDQSSSARLVTGGDTSPDGRRIALRTYSAVWGWTVDPDQTVADALAGTPCALPAIAEPQGEAVAFAPDSLAYFTISEGSFPVVHRFARSDQVDQPDCPPSPESCTAALRTSLVIRNRTDDTGDQLAFRWSKGPELEVSAFGNPGTDTPVNVCLYLNANRVGSGRVPRGVG